jgi:hypothetical protein
MNARGYLVVVMVTTLLGAAGCASRKKPMSEWAAQEKYQDYVPEKAKVVAEGPGKLSYTAAEYGTVFVVDVDETVKIKDATFPHALGSWLARPEDTVVFEPSTGRMGLAGTEGVRIKKVDPTHRHQLRFDPSNKDK